MRKILTLTLIFLFIMTSAALASKPIKIARLPIVIQKNRLDRETSAALEMKFARVVKIPLNGTLKIAEYIPPKESAQLLNEIWQEMYAEDKDARIANAVKIFARETKADLVVCPVLHRYWQRVSPISFSSEANLSSSVTAELIIYDKSTGKLIDRKISRQYNNNYSRFGMASYLANQCFDQLIKDTELRQIIHSKKG